MKLFDQFYILPRYITAFYYAGLNLINSPKINRVMSYEISKILD